MQAKRVWCVCVCACVRACVCVLPHEFSLVHLHGFLTALSRSHLSLLSVTVTVL